MTKKILLIDAMGLIFRAYYAMIKSPRFTTKGLNTSAMLGFTNSLYEVLKNEKPTHVAVAFDTGAPTFRHVEYEHYKENREATPDDIVTSIPYIKRILDAFQITMVGIDGYEADDLSNNRTSRRKNCWKPSSNSLNDNAWSSTSTLSTAFRTSKLPT